MRIGSSRADRIGFTTFAVMACLLAILVIASFDDEASESAEIVSAFADLPPATAVPTTEAISMPVPATTPAPFSAVLAAVPQGGAPGESDASANGDAD